MAEVEINNDRPQDLGRFNSTQVRHLGGKERQQQVFHATTSAWKGKEVVNTSKEDRKWSLSILRQPTFQSHHSRTEPRSEETPMEADVGQPLVLQSTTLGVSTLD